MQTSSFSVEIMLDTGGVRSVRVLGKDWGQSAPAHALLQRPTPLIEKLDAAAKRLASTGEVENHGGIQ